MSRFRSAELLTIEADGSVSMVQRPLDRVSADPVSATIRRERGSIKRASPRRFPSQGSKLLERKSRSLQSPPLRTQVTVYGSVSDGMIRRKSEFA